MQEHEQLHNMEKRAAVILLFLAAFLAGGILAQIRERLAHAAETENWGLSFQQEGQRPVANATIEELAAYDAWYAQDTEDKVIYLTFDCGYENGNTEKISGGAKKAQRSGNLFCSRKFPARQSGAYQTDRGRRAYRRQSHDASSGYVENL